MKREIGALLLLGLLAAASVWSIRRADTLIGEVKEHVGLSEKAVLAGDGKYASAGDTHRYCCRTRSLTEQAMPFLPPCVSWKLERSVLYPRFMNSFATISTASPEWSMSRGAQFSDHFSVRSFVSSSMKVLISLKLR